MFYPHIILPAVPPPPPPDPSSESEEGEIKPNTLVTDPVLDCPLEIQKWVCARQKNFPTKANILKKLQDDVFKIDRGDLSKMEIRMRQKLTILRNSYKKQENTRGRNPFAKYTHQQDKLLSNEVLKEHRIVLQCIRYLVSANFFE